MTDETTVETTAASVIVDGKRAFLPLLWVLVIWVLFYMVRTRNDVITDAVKLDLLSRRVTDLEWERNTLRETLAAEAAAYQG